MCARVTCARIVLLSIMCTYFEVVRCEMHYLFKLTFINFWYDFIHFGTILYILVRFYTFWYEIIHFSFSLDRASQTQERFSILFRP